ncbi:GHKL domain-containing protein [Dielma fastidiosa]|uniref:GHKL domain-containing protein n=1 Tax=Dielma fastidiosa TaxID=1034346 RepID=UPI003565461D
MNFNLLTFCCIAVICLIYHQLFKSKITLTITLICSTILLIAFTNIRAQSAIILTVLLLLAVSFRSSKLAELLILSYVTQSILLLMICITSVNYWETYDVLAADTMQIGGILLLFSITVFYFKFETGIYKLCSSFSKIENLFLLFLSWLLICFLIPSTGIPHYLDLYWAILAYGSFVLVQLCCFYLFYAIEIKMVEVTDKAYAMQALHANEKEIEELLNMKTAIARAYHELDNIRTLKDYYEKNFIPVTESVHTENDVLNYILNQEINRLKTAGYKLKLTVNFSVYPLTETQTALLFKNLFQNIHRHADKDAVVELKLIEVKKVFIILCSDRTASEHSSENTWQHGHGISIIKEIASSYNSHVIIQSNGTDYTIKILIPLI